MPQLDPEIERIRQRLKRCPMTLREIHDSTGLGWHWLRALSEGRSADPSYLRIRKLELFMDEHFSSAA